MPTKVGGHLCRLKSALTLPAWPPALQSVDDVRDGRIEVDFAIQIRLPVLFQRTLKLWPRAFPQSAIGVRLVSGYATFRQVDARDFTARVKDDGVPQSMRDRLLFGGAFAFDRVFDRAFPGSDHGMRGFVENNFKRGKALIVGIATSNRRMHPAIVHEGCVGAGPIRVLNRINPN